MLHQSLRSQPLSRRLAILVFGGAFSVMVAFLLWTTFHDVGTAKSVRLERTESVLSALSRDFYDLSVLRDTELNLDLVARFEAFGEVEAVCAWTTNSNDRYFLYQRTDNDLAPFRPPAIEPQMVGRALEFVHPQLIDGQVYGLTYIRVFSPRLRIDSQTWRVLWLSCHSQSRLERPFSFANCGGKSLNRFTHS